MPTAKTKKAPPTAAPTQPTEVQHQTLLTILQVLLHLAPAVAAPWTANGGKVATITAQELSVASAAIDAIAGKPAAK